MVPPKMVVPISALLTPIKNGACLEGQQKSGNLKHILEVIGKPMDNIAVVHLDNIIHEKHAVEQREGGSSSGEDVFEDAPEEWMGQEENREIHTYVSKGKTDSLLEGKDLLVDNIAISPMRKSAKNLLKRSKRWD